jgi:hypothetical protein
VVDSDGQFEHEPKCEQAELGTSPKIFVGRQRKPDEILHLTWKRPTWGAERSALSPEAVGRSGVGRATQARSTEPGTECRGYLLMGASSEPGTDNWVSNRPRVAPAAGRE